MLIAYLNAIHAFNVLLFDGTWTLSNGRPSKTKLVLLKRWFSLAQKQSSTPVKFIESTRTFAARYEEVRIRVFVRLFRLEG